MKNQVNAAQTSAVPTGKTTRDISFSADWQPTFSPWRHGGWYVDNLSYPSGAVGCVSRNYPDKKWRIVCDPRPFESRPTFPNRIAAARGERDLIMPPKCKWCGHAGMLSDDGICTHHDPKLWPQGLAKLGERTLPERCPYCHLVYTPDGDSVCPEKP